MTRKERPALRALARTADRTVAVLLVLAVAAGASLGLSPWLFAQRIPWDEGDLGAVATTTVKATRDYDIPDEETTRRKRDEAVSAVRAVYVHDTTALDGARRRVRAGFDLARETLAAAAPEEGRAALDAARPEIERALGARLEDAEFAALAADGFSDVVGAAVEGLVVGAMRGLVVGDREELAQHRGRGIAIVRMGAGGALADETLSEVDGIRDLVQVREALAAEPGLPRPLRSAVVELARREIRVNLKYDADLTRKRREAAAAAVKPVVIQLKKGEKIVEDGERIEERHLVIFRGMRAQAGRGDELQARLGGALFALVFLLAFAFFQDARGRRRLGSRDRAFVVVVLLCGLFGADLGVGLGDLLRERAPEIPAAAWTWALPFATAPMLVRMVLPGTVALSLAAIFALLVGVLAGNSLAVASFVLAGGVAGAARIARARERGGIFRAGVHAGIAQAAAVVAFALFDGAIASWTVLIEALVAFAGGALFAPLATIALLPVVETIFRYTTDLRLLELANLNHPALRELIVRAPGTYHHSIVVGTLVEGAAEAIGANPLLARVCALYHDLGKGRDPLSFGENQRGANVHDELPPEESARRIIEHVPRGIELARKYNLPRQVIDAIPQHHGTRLVGYFFHKAMKARGEGDPPVDPEPFRYEGPKPQAREYALVMMADAAEAASRAMQAPTAEKIEALVRKLIDGIRADGQLDECDITVRDLDTIARSFSATLLAIYHGRPVYPAAAAGPQRKLEAENRASERVA